MKPWAPVTEDWFTPRDEPEEGGTRFLLRTLDGSQSLQLFRKLYMQGDQLMLDDEGVAMAIDMALAGWENFGEVPFAKTNFGRLPPGVIVEIAQEIVKRTELANAEKKT